MNDYALWQDLLPILEKHGLVEPDVRVRRMPPRMMERRGAGQRVELVVRGRLRP